MHILAYYLGYRMARATVASNDVPLARCISLESGMQSSLLGLLLASRFFRDPLVSLPCGISTIFMTLVSCFGDRCTQRSIQASQTLQRPCLKTESMCITMCLTRIECTLETFRNQRQV